MHDSSELPTTNVLLAFGVNGPARPISGGQGKTYRAGDLVFKRLYGDDVEVAAEELIWIAGLLNDLPQRDFRAPRYKPSNNGEWTVDGWYAQEWVDGANDLSQDRWSQLIQTCKAFHTALADTVRPCFMDQRNDPWARADRIAWNEMPLVCYPELRPLLDKLVAKLRPVNLACQVIHGDFTGNVLFARNLPPAVIDFSPYFRPCRICSRDYHRRCACLEGRRSFNSGFCARRERDRSDASSRGDQKADGDRRQPQAAGKR